MKQLICGIDEAGRGPLAGPVTAAAVMLPEDFPFDILDDSKKLSEKKKDRNRKDYQAKSPVFCCVPCRTHYHRFN